jgi:hypothetical protein
VGQGRSPARGRGSSTGARASDPAGDVLARSAGAAALVRGGDEARALAIGIDDSHAAPPLLRGGSRSWDLRMRRAERTTAVRASRRVRADRIPRGVGAAGRRQRRGAHPRFTRAEPSLRPAAPARSSPRSRKRGASGHSALRGATRVPPSRFVARAHFPLRSDTSVRPEARAPGLRARRPLTPP